MRKTPQLIHVTGEWNPQGPGDPFSELLRSALLLALRETGRLSPMEYRHAEQLRSRQRLEQARRNREAP